MGCFQLWRGHAEAAGREVPSGFWGGKEAWKEAPFRGALVLSQG